MVRKHQYSICTMSYYDIVEYSLYDCGDSCIKATAAMLGMDAAELYEIIETKLEPLRERLEANSKARSTFSKRYGVAGDEYDRCYDVFGVLRNKGYLEQIKAQHKARKQAERKARSSYQERWRSTYEHYTSGSYSVPAVSTYTAEETAILKQFYRSLSKTYHPDLNPGKDTTPQMQLLNKLKEAWGA